MLDALSIFVMLDVERDGGASDDLLCEQVDALEREDLVGVVAKRLVLVSA